MVHELCVKGKRILNAMLKSFYKCGQLSKSGDIYIDVWFGNILGQSYNANDIINADIWKTIHPKFPEFRMKVKQTFLLHYHK